MWDIHWNWLTQVLEWFSDNTYVCLFLLLSELYEREFLDKCLSRALNIPLQDGRLIAIDEENYVLTLDFTIKMLQIHERYVCGEPIILQGETGVGKTSLLQMLSKLWNVSLDMELKRLKERVLEFLQNKLKNGKWSVETILCSWWDAVTLERLMGVDNWDFFTVLYFVTTLNWECFCFCRTYKWGWSLHSTAVVVICSMSSLLYINDSSAKMSKLFILEHI